MQSRGRFFVWILFVMLTCGAGYLWWQGEPAEFGEDDAVAIAPLKAVALPGSTAKKQKLDVTLKPGDYIPLRKTVVETVTQSPLGQAAGRVATSETRLEILLVLTVEVVEAKRTKFRVHYQHVRYTQTLGDSHIHYDSKRLADSVPAEAQPYHGLVGNSFEFWIDENHKVVELVDFQGFLKRCVKHVAPSQQDAVLRRFVSTTGEERVANFIDDSIGLLPTNGTLVKQGEIWERKRQVARPVPLLLSDKCQLSKLTDEFAEIVINGTVVPSAPFGQPSSELNGMQFTVTGGYTTGECRIRRQTGLPEHSKIRRVFDMLVRLPDGTQFKQTKDSTTVISVYSPQGAPIAMPEASSPKAEPRRLGSVIKAGAQR